MTSSVQSGAKGDGTSAHVIFHDPVDEVIWIVSRPTVRKCDTWTPEDDAMNDVLHVGCSGATPRQDDPAYAADAGEARTQSVPASSNARRYFMYVQGSAGVTS